jgi:hypothetical protein
MTPDAILEQVWPKSRAIMILRKVSLYDLLTLGEEVAVFTNFIFAYDEMRMRPDPGLPSLKQIRIR